MKECERPSVRPLSMPVARNVALSVLTKGAKHDEENFWLDPDEQILGGLVLSIKLLSLRSGGRIFE